MQLGTEMEDAKPSVRIKGWISSLHSKKPKIGNQFFCTHIIYQICAFIHIWLIPHDAITCYEFLPQRQASKIKYCMFSITLAWNFYTFTIERSICVKWYTNMQIKKSKGKCLQLGSLIQTLCFFFHTFFHLLLGSTSRTTLFLPTSVIRQLSVY